MEYHIQDHRIISGNVHQVNCRKNHLPLRKLEGIIIHYTAGASLQSAVRHLSDSRTRVSAHLIIGRDCSIYQLVPFNIKAWHAGKSAYRGRTNMNDYTIGIELENYGPLTKEGVEFKTWFNKIVPINQIWRETQGNHTRYWHDYNLRQLATTLEVCKVLIQKYNLSYIAGHSDITSRKQDPGPSFPLDYFKQLIPTNTLF